MIVFRATVLSLVMMLLGLFPFQVYGGQKRALFFNSIADCMRRLTFVPDPGVTPKLPRRTRKALEVVSQNNPLSERELSGLGKELTALSDSQRVAVLQEISKLYPNASIDPGFQSYSQWSGFKRAPKRVLDFMFTCLIPPQMIFGRAIGRGKNTIEAFQEYLDSIHAWLPESRGFRHFRAEEVIELARQAQATLKKIVLTAGPNSQLSSLELALTGSVAKGTSRNGSDLDIALGGTGDEFYFDVVEEKFKESFNKILEAAHLHLDHLIGGPNLHIELIYGPTSPIILEITADKIKLVVAPGGLIRTRKGGWVSNSPMVSYLIAP